MTDAEAVRALQEWRANTARAPINWVSTGRSLEHRRRSGRNISGMSNACGPLFVLYTLGTFITLRSWLFLLIAPIAPMTTVFLLLIGSYAGGVILLAATILPLRHHPADARGRPSREATQPTGCA